MEAPRRLEPIDGIGIFRPVGCYRFQQAVAIVSEAIKQNVELGLRKMLIDLYGLNGFDPPSISERHWMVREWVFASSGKLKVAMLVPNEHVDPDKFGIVAAANFGVTAEVFTSEDEAMDWLRRN